MSAVSPSAASPVRIDLERLLALRAAGAVRLPAAGRTAAAGAGGHRSRFRSRGMEFAEVRAYQPGDDVRSIDWRVTARRGQVHTKLFHEEREAPVLLVLDYRRPMFFATRGRFKAVLASELAAMLAWRARADGDRVGGFLFSETGQCALRPSRGQRGVLRLLHQMAADPAWQRPPHAPFEPRGRLAQTVQALGHLARPGSRILFLSDFAQWDAAVEQQFALLGRQAQLAFYFIYDPLEAELPAAGSYRVSDGRSDLVIATDAPDLRQRYRSRFQDHRQRLQRFCQQQRARFLAVATDRDPVQVLDPQAGEERFGHGPR